MRASVHWLCAAFMFSLTTMDARAEVVSECDTLAASPNDAMRRDGLPGVPFDAIETDRAIPACEAALALRPDDTRIKYQLARSLDKAGQDPPRVFELLKDSAAHGYILAMNDLAVSYQDGRGVDKDAGAALLWYERAASAGLSISMRNAGMLHEKGEGTARNIPQALEWYELAAARGDVWAITRSGFLHKKGGDVPKDYAKARMWLNKASAAGDAEARRLIEELDTREDGDCTATNIARFEHALYDRVGEAARARYKLRWRWFPPSDWKGNPSNYPYGPYRELVRRLPQGTSAIFYDPDRYSPSRRLCVWVVTSRGLVAGESVPISRPDIALGLQDFLNVKARAAGRVPVLKNTSRGAVSARPASVAAPEPTAGQRGAGFSLHLASAQLLPPSIARALIAEAVSFRGNKLMILPIAELAEIPFGALEFNDANLIDTFEIIVLSEIDAILQRGGEQYVPGAKSLIVGDPDLSMDSKWAFPKLPGARSEVISIGRLVGATPLLGGRCELLQSRSVHEDKQQGVVAHLFRDTRRLGCGQSHGRRVPGVEAEPFDWSGDQKAPFRQGSAGCAQRVPDGVGEVVWWGCFRDCSRLALCGCFASDSKLVECQ